jgi:hypothetical protein
MGRTKLIETPEKLMEIFEEYRAYTLANPIQIIGQSVHT